MQIPLLSTIFGENIEWLPNQKVAQETYVWMRASHDWDFLGPSFSEQQTNSLLQSDFGLIRKHVSQSYDGYRGLLDKDRGMFCERISRLPPKYWPACELWPHALFASCPRN